MPCPRRRDSAIPFCRDDRPSSSLWCKPDEVFHPLTTREPWRCPGTKAFAATAARVGRAAAWNLIRKLKRLLAFGRREKRAKSKKLYHSEELVASKIHNLSSATRTKRIHLYKSVVPGFIIPLSASLISLRSAQRPRIVKARLVLDVDQADQSARISP